MKKTIATMAITAIFSLLNLNSFAQESNKETTKETIKDNSASDFKKFKEEMRLKMKKNEIDIEKLKAKKADANKDIQNTYDKRLAELKQKNNELKKKMESFKESTESKWHAFKEGFNKSMDEIGKSISEMAQNNMNNN